MAPKVYPEEVGRHRSQTKKEGRAFQEAGLTRAKAGQSEIPDVSRRETNNSGMFGVQQGVERFRARGLSRSQTGENNW